LIGGVSTFTLWSSPEINWKNKIERDTAMGRIRTIIVIPRFRLNTFTFFIKRSLKWRKKFLIGLYLVVLTDSLLSILSVSEVVSSASLALLTLLGLYSASYAI
jgi:hypothetical protein